MAQLSDLVQPLIDAGWFLGEPSEDWDSKLGTSAIISMTRVRDVLDVELFATGWLQVFAYDEDYEPDDDEPSEPVFWLEDPSALVTECLKRGWLS
jgi:hypothetical protein